MRDTDREFLLRELAEELSRYHEVTATRLVNKGIWLRATYRRSSILVSVDHAGRIGWVYRWGNQRDRSGPTTELLAVAAQIVALLKSRSPRRTPASRSRTP
ncbi:hypothetical protein C1I98_26015 [Spongiactinospora gelatinilytica]|uniref:Uncharacterized protein n=1 Tax=Spongiactinospora gelatinilytica TaxID=2666298 RepID=A0A2W2FMU9_9ACTN|nr:hypothetical protein [Spongiactinospora gelatinilytica]PZG37091.1 hypothetical protein C1I98_26015 [Spongiactinospora gelatinilytica]